MADDDFAVTDLTAIDTPDGADLFHIIDVSDTVTEPAGPDGSDKKITLDALATFLGTGGGTGTVTSVNGVDPVSGDVTLTASDVGALAPDGNGSALTGITHGQVSGLGSAALAATTAFDAAGAAAAVTLASLGAASAANLATEVTRAEAAEALLAPKASPAFTGNPTAPTQTSGNNTTRIATTAFVAAAVSGLSSGGSGGATLPFTVVSPSDDETGVADAAAIMAAIASLPATGGTVKLVPGVWYIKCGQVVIEQSGIYLDAWACRINAVGAGDVIRIFDTDYADRAFFGGGILGYPTIDGSATTGNSTGVHAGDILQLAMFVQVQNFTAGTTSKGIWFDNEVLWTEQLFGRVYVQGCTTCVQFDLNGTGSAGDNATGSFARACIDIFVDNQGLGDGVVITNGCFLYDGKLGIYGNFAYGTGSTQWAVLRVAGGTSEFQTSIFNCALNIGVEQGGTSNAHPATTIAFDNANCWIYDCMGTLDFSVPDNSFAQCNMPSQLTGFVGTLDGDDSLTITGVQNATVTTGGGVGGGFPAGVVPLTDAATVSVDASQGSEFRLASMSANRTLGKPSNGLDGQKITVVVNPSTHTLSYATGINWGSAGAPTLVASKDNYLGLAFNATASEWRGLAFAGGF